MASSDIEVNFQDVQEAAKRIAPYIHKTPVMTCSTLDSLAGRTLHFKCELFQKVGAFKVSDENIVTFSPMSNKYCSNPQFYLGILKRQSEYI